MIIASVSSQGSNEPAYVCSLCLHTQSIAVDKGLAKKRDLLPYCET